MDFGTVLIVIGVIFLLSFLVETLIEFLFAPLFNNVPALEAWKWAQFYLAVIAAVVGAFIYQFDLLFLLGQFLEATTQSTSPIQQSPYGVAITGVAIGHGAAYLHDAVMRYFRKPEFPEGDLIELGFSEEQV